jgi:hypothetical protein
MIWTYTAIAGLLLQQGYEDWTGNSDGLRGRRGQVDDPTGCKRSSIVYGDQHAQAVAPVRHANAASTGQRSVRGRKRALIELAAACDSAPTVSSVCRSHSLLANGRQYGA